MKVGVEWQEVKTPIPLRCNMVICVSDVVTFLREKGWLFAQLGTNGDDEIRFLGSHKQRNNKNSRYYRLDVIVTPMMVGFTRMDGFYPTHNTFEYMGNDFESLVAWYEEMDIQWGFEAL